MHLRKYHAHGNDFLILLDLDGHHVVDGDRARALCDRHRGVGADGLIWATAGVDGADATMGLFNADGGRAETSGNGLRCLVRALVDTGTAPGPEVTIATDAGLRRAAVVVGDATDGSIAVEMGMPTVKDADTDGAFPRAAVVDVGNPHTVWLVDEVKDLYEPDVEQRAALVAGTCVQPVNVEVVAARPEGGLISRVWERGVGETLSCGSGAVATAAAAHEWGLAGDRVAVYQPGGHLTVELRPDGALLSGPAQFVFTVEVDG